MVKNKKDNSSYVYRTFYLNPFLKLNELRIVTGKTKKAPKVSILYECESHASTELSARISFSLRKGLKLAALLSQTGTPLQPTLLSPTKTELPMSFKAL